LDGLVINITGLESFNISEFTESTGLVPSALLEGNITIKRDFLAATLNQSDLANVNMTIEDAIAAFLNLTFLPRALAHNFTVVHTYSDSFGKTTGNSGNSAIVDCHFLNQLLQTTFQQTFDRILDLNPLYFVILKQLGSDIRSAIDELNFCAYAMNINGLLKDQADVYSGSKVQQARRLSLVSQELIGALSQDANITVSLPIKEQMDQVSIV
jgi:hypothetical protein